MSDLELRAISKTFANGNVVLAPLDLHVCSGEFLVLVGPSGCGKSTLLRLIAGLEEATSGAVFLDGRDITPLPPAERDVAMVFQNYALYPHMTVAENISFGLRIRKLPKVEREGAIREVASLLGLGDLLQRKPGQLSGGQRQRVAVGRAIVRRPKLFLFDEPLSNLDAALRASTRAELRRLHQNLKATTVYVTHDQVEAMSMADRLVVLRAGKIEQMGTPLEIYRRPRTRFVATFIGSPPMKIVRGTLAPTALCIAGMTLPLPSAARELTEDTSSRPIDIGLRAEHLSLHAEPNASTLPVTILLAESMGNEVLLTCALPDGQEVIVRASANEVAAPGSVRHLLPDLESASYFDHETGVALIGRSLDAFPRDAAHQVAL